MTPIGHPDFPCATVREGPLSIAMLMNWSLFMDENQHHSAVVSLKGLSICRS